MSLLLSFLLAFLPLQVSVPPTPNHLVTDYTQTLSPQETANLEQMLLLYEDSTSVQIAIALFQNIGGYDIAEYAVEVGRAWQVGTKDNKGVLILVSKDDRKVFIAPGYGLEGALPDATVKTIITHYFIPFVKEGNYYEAFYNTILAIQQSLSGEELSPKSKEKTPQSSVLGFVIFMVIIVISIFIASRRRNNRNGGDGGGGMSAIAPLILLGGMNQSRGWGSGGFGGGSGGGFGGFGGGSFGGGGSGGSW